MKTKKATAPRETAARRSTRMWRELSTARTLGEVQAIVVRSARAVCGADGATFVLRNGEYCTYAEEDAIAPLWKGQRSAASTCISGWAMLNRSSAVIEDVYADPRIRQDAYRPTFVKSLAIVPIGRSHPIGAIGVYWSRRHKPTVAELRVLQALGDRAAKEIARVASPTDGGGIDRPLRERAEWRCQNLYAFIRHRVGPAISDRELARRWGMSWRSFANLKVGARRIPRFEELEELGGVLGVDPLLVMVVARGQPAEVVNRALLGGDETLVAALLAEVRLNTSGAPAALRVSLDRLPCAVFTLDAKGHFADINGRVEKLLGSGIRDIVGASVVEFLDAYSAPILTRLLAHALEVGEAGPAVVAFENGTKVALSVVQIVGHDGNPIGFQCRAQVIKD